MLIGYARTSTTDQSAGFDAQRDALTRAGCQKTFSEQVSAIGKRTQLEAALEWCRESDTLVVTKLDRLARSTTHLLALIEHLEKKGVSLRILDFAGSIIDSKSPQGRLMLTLFGAIAEFERALMLERQRDGIAQAKRDGKYKGRIPTARRQADKVIALRSAGKRPDDIAEALQISRASVFRVLKQARAAEAKTRRVLSRQAEGDRENEMLELGGAGATAGANPGDDDTPAFTTPTTA